MTDTQRFWAGGFLYSPEKNEVFLHLRDGNTRFNPNKYAFFGGLQEGSESPSQCFIRELSEEIGITARKEEVTPLCDYLNEELNTYRHVFYIKNNLPKSAFILGEGRGFEWIPLSKVGEYPLTDKTREDLERFKINLK